MATNFTITEKKNNRPTPTGHYESNREHQDEMRRIAKVEKELKKHESEPISKAHKKG